jgi:hypothetical protein
MPTPPRLVITNSYPTTLAEQEAVAQAIREWNNGENALNWHHKEGLISPCDANAVWETVALARPCISYRPSMVAHRVK